MLCPSPRILGFIEMNRSCPGLDEDLRALKTTVTGLRREQHFGLKPSIIACSVALLALIAPGPVAAEELPGTVAFTKDIQPILREFCYDCHGDGSSKGGVTFDQFKNDQALLENRDLWWKALKNLRAGMMPPQKKPQPAQEHKLRIEHWIKSAVFDVNPKNLDPGRVTVRRLNRVEYRNTIRDLMGIDFNAEAEFPPDDSGHGFDNIGDVLTLPSMLLEKYLVAAKTIVSKAVPTSPGEPAEKVGEGRSLEGGEATSSGRTNRGSLASTPALSSYDRFFPTKPPRDPSARHRYARELIEAFAAKAFRRPVDTKTVDRLVALAESVSNHPGNSFEAGIAQAMVAVLASPRFLFREEGIETDGDPKTHPNVDEYALASRLSYFYWSSMPDEELFRLAAQRKLRQNLAAQSARMLADPRSHALIRNFTGQWLQTRDIEGVPIDARQVLAREAAPDLEFDRRRQRFRELREKPEESLTDAEKKEIEDFRATFGRRFRNPPRAELTGDLRRAMRLETEKLFDYVLRKDRSVLELIDSDYTFLNERLAKHYGLTNANVVGDELRLVSLPADSPRGGILTHGSVLAVTSNPTRTSPVKRGLFILDNILGIPPPPPPPDIPPLEDAVKNIKDRPVSLRETLALHRAEPLCSSCHNRMDPLGLALENFNAMGMWRDKERNEPIDATGKLVSGETFTHVKELKRILATQHAAEFYRTLTEKMLTYALGRGLEYYDVGTVDRIVEQLQLAEGRPSALLAGIVESAPFQKTRASTLAKPFASAPSSTQSFEIRTTP